MLTTRPFCNADPPLLLELWTKSQSCESRASLIPLSMDVLHMQMLGQPFFDRRSIILAFDHQTPVGYVHTTPGPNADSSDLGRQTGQICFMAIDPTLADSVQTAKTLLAAAEEYLTGLGIREIFGGSPRPCAPFYTGFYGAAEAIGFFDSDAHLIQAFQESGYEVVKNTVRFQKDLQHFVPHVSASTIGQMKNLDVDINEMPIPKTWWEACSFAPFAWVEAVAKLKTSGRTVARVRARIMEIENDALFSSPDAGLMDVRVLPDFHRQGVAAFTLGELLRYLAFRRRVRLIEAHIADDTATMFALLRSLHWNEIDRGKVFRKCF